MLTDKEYPVVLQNRLGVAAPAQEAKDELRALYGKPRRTG
jgi:hypothetical protein